MTNQTPDGRKAEEQPTRADATATPAVLNTGSRWGDADRLPGPDADYTDGPPCTRTGCGQAPAAHLGWALRHLWTMTDTRPVTAPPTDVEKAATSYVDGPGCTPAAREEVECTPLRIDGILYCCGVCEACNAVTPQ